MSKGRQWVYNSLEAWNSFNVSTLQSVIGMRHGTLAGPGQPGVHRWWDPDTIPGKGSQAGTPSAFQPSLMVQQLFV